MTYKDYQAVKWGKQESVGMFGCEIYSYEKLMGSNSMPSYIQIMKAEFDAFGVWSETKRAIINSRPYLCIAADGEYGEISEYDIEVHCPVCHNDFLLSHRKPDHIPIESCCPKCRKWTDRRLNLVAELERQLKKAELVVDNLYAELRFLYLEPYAQADMVGYVMIGSDCYYLKVAERGKPILEYCVKDMCEAVYWILFQIVEQAVQETESEWMEDYALWEQRKKASMLGYFEKMNLVYRGWFVGGRSLWRFKEDGADKNRDFSSKRTRFIKW